MKQFSYVLLTICSLTFLLCIDTSNIVFAQSTPTDVIRISRVMHPEFAADHLHLGKKGYFNRDNTLVLMSEQKLTVFNERGRGVVWGNIINLKSIAGSDPDNYAGTVTQYKSAATPLPDDNRNRTQENSIWWSNIVGEESVVYSSYRNGGNNTCEWIKRIDVATESSWTEWVQISDSNCKMMRCTGWDEDDNLICGIDGETGGGGAYVVDVVNKTATFEAYEAYPRYAIATGSCSKVSDQFWSWPDRRSHGHSAKSEARDMYAGNYGRGGRYERGVFVKNNCGGNEYYVTDSVSRGAHMSWGPTGEWFMVSTGAGGWSNGGWRSSPHIMTAAISQAFFTRNDANRTGSFESYPVLLMDTAGPWETVKGSNSPGDNYQSLGGVTVSKDGRQMYFLSTNGKYSHEDCSMYGGYACGSNMGTPGVFLADLAPVSGAQTCTSFTYSTWSECQPPSTVSGQGTQTRTVISSSPSGCYGGDPELTQPCTFVPDALYNLFKVAGTPAIDGNLGEYTLANPLTFSPTTGGNTITVRTLWDDEALYLGINVTDTQLNASVTSRDGSVWSEDSIEWFIDLDNDGGGSADPSSTYMSTNDYHGIVNILNAKYDSQGTISGTPSGSWNGTWESEVKLNGTNNDNIDTDTGYTIEIKIPWTTIGYSSAPSQDTLIGMSFALNDNDSDGVTSIMLPDIITGFENASNWQSVFLSGTIVGTDTMPPAPPKALLIL